MISKYKDAENALKDLNSYDELLETDNKLKRIIEDKEEIYGAKVGVKNFRNFKKLFERIYSDRQS